MEERGWPACVIGTVPHAGAKELDAALAGATEGFRVWRANTSAAKPAAIILQAAPLIRERVEDIAATMTL